MEPKEVYIGCSGFSNRDWKGEFYPAELRAKDYLGYYARHFNAVEVNASFYRKPQAATLQRWRDETPAGFRFFMNMPKSVTHVARMRDAADEAAAFCGHAAAHLQEKLAGFLYQLPPSFAFSEAHLQRVMDTVEPSCLNVVEFRHPSWWTAPVMEALRGQGIVFSGVSIPMDIPDEVVDNHCGVVYYRLHGTPVMFKSAYPDMFLNHLAERLKSGPTAYVFFNNTWGMSAVHNARYLQRRLA